MLGANRRWIVIRRLSGTRQNLAPALDGPFSSARACFSREMYFCYGWPKVLARGGVQRDGESGSGGGAGAGAGLLRVVSMEQDVTLEALAVVTPRSVEIWHCGQVRT